MKISFVLTGQQPILFHADDVLASDDLMAWRKDPKNKGVSVPGDDRSPPWTWQTYLYSDGENIAIPFDNLGPCLRKAGAKVILKKQLTFKEASQSGILPIGSYIDFFGKDGKKVPLSKIHELKTLPFKDQYDAVAGMGFSLFVKRAVVGSSKHVRVRARFDHWTASGNMIVSNDMIPELTLGKVKEIFDIAGRVGLLDWRPGSPKSPGVFGMFSASVKEVK